jgi:hypothetical protein
MLKKEGKGKEKRKKCWRDTVAKWILHLALDKLMDAPFSLLLSHFG